MLKTSLDTEYFSLDQNQTKSNKIKQNQTVVV